MFGIPLPMVNAPNAEMLGLPVHVARPPYNYSPITSEYDWPNEMDMLINVCGDMKQASACVVFFPAPGQRTGTCVVYRAQKELKTTSDNV